MTTNHRQNNADNSAESDDETLQSAGALKRDRKSRSLRNLFARLKRSSSSEAEKDEGPGS